MKKRPLHQLFDLREVELQPLLWATGYFFCILAGYYVLRPIRDEMGLAGGVQNLPWLFTGTLTVMLLVHPPFAVLVAKLSRVKFVKLTYRFFSLNLIVFYLLLSHVSADLNIWIGRVFYVWTSVFNLFVVSVFWAFMADSFNSDQGKRLFGFIAFGGTLGAVVGSALTASLAGLIRPINLLWVTVFLLEGAIFFMKRHSSTLSALATFEPSKIEHHVELKAADLEEPLGGSIWAGMLNLVRSPYLMGIAGYILLFTTTATFLYFQQAEIIRDYSRDRMMRTALFARIDFAVNSLAMLTQLFLTNRIIAFLGFPLTLTLLPALCLLGFGSLSQQPTLWVLVVFQVLRRACDYAIARPAREVLFTTLKREDKYKAKNLVDTFIYRAGDQIGAWSYALLSHFGFGVAAISFVAMSLVGFWTFLGFWLGRVLPGTRR